MKYFKIIAFIVSTLLLIVLFYKCSNTNNLIAERTSFYGNCPSDILFFERDSCFYILKDDRIEDGKQIKLMQSFDEGSHWSTLFAIEGKELLSNQFIQKDSFVYFIVRDTLDNYYLEKLNYKCTTIQSVKLNERLSLKGAQDNHLFLCSNNVLFIYDLNLNLLEKKDYNRCFHTYSYLIANDRTYCLCDSGMYDLKKDKIYRVEIDGDFLSYSETTSQLFILGRNKSKYIELDYFNNEGFQCKKIFSNLKFVDLFKVESDGFMYAICKKDYNTNFTLIYSIDNGNNWQVWDINNPIVDGIIYSNKKLYIFVRGLVKPANVYTVSPYN